MAEGIQVVNGVDVRKTAIKDMLFTSEAISLKNVIYGAGEILPTTNDLTYGWIAQVTIQHNLGYAPTHFLYFRPANANASPANIITSPWIGDTNDPTVWSFIDNFQCSTVVDTVNLNVYFQHGQANVPFEYRYFILVERAT